MSKKIVIRVDIICEKKTSEIFSAVAKLEGIKSIVIDQEKNTVTVVGAVDPVRIVKHLRKACFAATIVSVEDDKPKEEKKTPCQEACEKACKEKCEKLCKTCEKACKEKCEKACKDKCDDCGKACKEARCETVPWDGYGYSYGYGVPALPLGYGCYGRPFYF